MKRSIYILAAGILIVSACKSNKSATEATEAESATTEEVRKDPPPREGSTQDRGARLEEMATKLGLNADQTIEFKAIETKYAEKMQAARGEGRDAMKALMDAKMAELSTVLTSGQLTQYKEIIAQRREARGGRGGRR